MKKTIIIICAICILTPSVIFAGRYVSDRGDWSEWWAVGNERASVKRIYDKENKLVCWLYSGVSLETNAIDCEPSLELNHPLTQ